MRGIFWVRRTEIPNTQILSPSQALRQDSEVGRRVLEELCFTVTARHRSQISRASPQFRPPPAATEWPGAAAAAGRAPACQYGPENGAASVCPATACAVRGQSENWRRRLGPDRHGDQASAPTRRCAGLGRRRLPRACQLDVTSLSIARRFVTASPAPPRGSALVPVCRAGNIRVRITVRPQFDAKSHFNWWARTKTQQLRKQCRQI